MYYWEGEVPKDFLGDEILRESKGAEEEQTRPLFWSSPKTFFLIQIYLILGTLKDEFEVSIWQYWIFI